MVSPPSFTFFSSHLLVIPLLVGFLFQEESWCSQLLRTLFFMVGLLWAMGLRAEPSLIRTLPGACVSVPSEMRCRHSLVGGHTPHHWAHSRSLGTLPQLVPVVSAPSEMMCGSSLVDGGGCWAPSPLWCL